MINQLHRDLTPTKCQCPSDSICGNLLRSELTLSYPPLYRIHGMCDDSGTVWTNQGLDYSGQMTAPDQSEASNIKLSKRLRKCMFYIYTLLLVCLVSSLHCCRQYTILALLLFLNLQGDRFY